MPWKKAVLFGLIGFVSGTLICAAFILLGGSAERPPAQVILHLLTGGVFGAVAMGSSLVYGIEKWSIFRATATHFLLVFGLYSLIGFSLGWFRLNDAVTWIIFAVMLAVYTGIWLCQYLAYRSRIRQMNDDLKKLKSGRKAG